MVAFDTHIHGPVSPLAVTTHFHEVSDITTSNT